MIPLERCPKLWLGGLANLRTKLIALALAATAAQVVSATIVIESFETDIWNPVPNHKLTSASTTLGVTHGSRSMAIEDVSAVYTDVQRQFTGPEYQAFKLNTHLLMDVFVPAQSSQQHVYINLALWGPGMDWTRVTPVDRFLDADVELRETISWDYAALAATLDPLQGEDFSLSIYAGTAYRHLLPQKVYVDNIRVVPEPMSMTALGLGAAALFWKRRKKK